MAVDGLAEENGDEREGAAHVGAAGFFHVIGAHRAAIAGELLASLAAEKAFYQGFVALGVNPFEGDLAEGDEGGVSIPDVE